MRALLFQFHSAHGTAVIHYPLMNIVIPCRKWSSDSEPAMQAKQRTLPLEARARRDQATRLKRFVKHLERWYRGEPVQSYDTKWLAFVRERQLKRAHRRCKIDCAHGV
jgi:hypothetical protein